MLHVFLIVVGSSAGIFILMWLVVYALQFVRPDEALPVHLDQDLVRRVRMKAGNTTQVAFSDIRQMERSRVLVGASSDEYVFEEGYSSGFPEKWLDDLYRHQN